MSLLNEKQLKNFEDKVERVPFSECQYWTACTIRGGYGHFKVNGTMMKAHRVAYEQFVGPIPKCAFILHSCDQPSCVNPKHLRTGTHQENMDDMKKRDRQAKPKGETNGRVKLTETEVAEIRKLYAAGGISHRALAGRFGVARSLISFILNYKRWTHI